MFIGENLLVDESNRVLLKELTVFATVVKYAQHRKLRFVLQMIVAFALAGMKHLRECFKKSFRCC